MFYESQFDWSCRILKKERALSYFDRWVNWVGALNREGEKSFKRGPYYQRRRGGREEIWGSKRKKS